MIVIPARLASTRLKNKILLDIFGVPMFIKTAQNASKVDNVLIAVDDESVLKIAKNYGFNALMTDSNHKSGSDRIKEAVNNFGIKDDEIIINVQADEPFFEKENLIIFKEFAKKAIYDEEFFMASCYKIVDKKLANDPNLVKVVTDKNSSALYFSRSIIPYPREEFNQFKAHIGIYAYSKENLNEFCTLSKSILEDVEKLEQLRALENGKAIKMLEIKTDSFGIDTKEDYEKIINLKGK